VVVVRARINVDPETSELTVTTDETGPYAVPQIVFGVPLRLQRITVDIDSPDFMFNPSSCAAQQITAVISGSQQSVANVSSPFAVGGCKSLEFKPLFSVETSSHTSRTQGASLDVKLSYPPAPFGSQANIKSVHVELPKILPSRLSTLQQACPSKTFEVNAANCPPGSIVGIARTSTPLLPVTLEGPAFFVSYGGQQFPELIIVLQGEGVRVDLHGETFINEKTNVTSSTFRTVPDVPVNSFELYLPQGRNSALAATGDLCSQALYLPVTFTAQNGAILEEKPKISVSGCKPQIQIQSHVVHGGIATIATRVPSAGRLTATGTGLTRVTKKISKAGLVTVSLSATHVEKQLLAKHPTTQGTKMTASITVVIR
jgi:hypothetical protein